MSSKLMTAALVSALAVLGATVAVCAAVARAVEFVRKVLLGRYDHAH